jgi:hypothetical protein
MAARWNQRLVHVQGNSAGRTNMAKIDPALRQEYRSVAAGAQGLVNQRFRSADIGQAIDVFRKLAHDVEFSCEVAKQRLLIGYYGEIRMEGVIRK